MESTNPILKSANRPAEGQLAQKLELWQRRVKLNYVLLRVKGASSINATRKFIFKIPSNILFCISYAKQQVTTLYFGADVLYILQCAKNGGGNNEHV